ncbi:Hypothetical predicted protein [Pelobates cultripes]|uniref:Uncharacterized protein n=1 Tax=Pelobates cultripes TaxID=61616 RepID=A0AAD1RFF2_PELCU|nr:Hypothetical predicted protein [Pelobates cultripes]
MSDTCWRCQKDRGTMMVWWQCSELQQYWQQVADLTTKCSNIQLPYRPATFLLLLLQYTPQKHQRYLTYHIIIAALTIISRKWKQPPPTITQCVTAVDTNKIYETIARNTQ